jgi:demethylmenaquinone methyltransferase/2-methoxy-6-polyprenyl-1,4-benzoquinol methylase
MVSTRPPSPLASAFGEEATKQEWVNWVFSRVAPRYDLGNDLMSAGWHTRWKRRLVEEAAIQPGDRVLDLACGTGDVTFLVGARAWRGEVVGLDINAEMMAVAEQKRPPGMENVSFVGGDAGRLPFPDESFDKITCVYAGRGFPSWPAVISEAWRVLRPGGTFSNLDFARPPNRRLDRVVRGYMTVSGAVLGAALHGNPQTYTYIPNSMRHYRGQRWLDEQLRAVGFETRLEETLGCLMAFNLAKKPLSGCA